MEVLIILLAFSSEEFLSPNYYNNQQILTSVYYLRLEPFAGASPCLLIEGRLSLLTFIWSSCFILSSCSNFLFFSAIIFLNVLEVSFSTFPFSFFFFLASFCSLFSSFFLSFSSFFCCFISSFCSFSSLFFSAFALFFTDFVSSGL